MTKIKIALPNDIIEVDAEPIEIRLNGRDDLRFYAHKTPDNDGTKPTYTVSEHNTGMACGNGQTKQGAIERATRNVQKAERTGKLKGVLSDAIRTLLGNGYDYPIND